jgi:CDP-diacylglycerol--glycerol-3-phosphate 3-phosphatidyltransferase
MPSVYHFKPAFQSFLRPAVGWLARRKVTANEVTIAALALSSIQGLLIVWQPAAALPLFFMPLTLFARMALNAIDGMLAREHGSASPAGVVLNELGDGLADLVLYLPLALVPGVPGALLVIIVCLALLSETAALVALQISGTRGNQGPLGKSDRAVLFGGLAVALGFRLSTDFWLTALLILTIALLGATIVNRVACGLRRALPEGQTPTSACEGRFADADGLAQQTEILEQRALTGGLHVTIGSHCK